MIDDADNDYDDDDDDEDEDSDDDSLFFIVFLTLGSRSLQDDSYEDEYTIDGDGFDHHSHHYQSLHILHFLYCNFIKCHNHRIKHTQTTTIRSLPASIIMFITTFGTIHYHPSWRF